MTMETIFNSIPSVSSKDARMTVTSFYITVRDSTRLAADLYLPDPLPPGGRLPTLLEQTRYWRSSEMRGPLGWFQPRTGTTLGYDRRSKRWWTAQGFAYLAVDVRGTGASFGVHRYPWEPVTLEDVYDILEWITRQPWSDGQVAGLGISYMGSTAELLLASGHPALKAVMPQFNHPDPFIDIAFPGGMFNQRFITAWGEMDENLDLNRTPPSFGKLINLMPTSVRPVGGKAGRSDLAAALQDHQKNIRVHHLDASEIAFRDARHPEGSFRSDDSALVQFYDRLRASPVPVYRRASWMDAGTAAAALRRFNDSAGPQRVIIGAWNHGGVQQSSPYQQDKAPISPPHQVTRLDMLHFLKNAFHTPQDLPERQLVYYTLGAESWQASSTWPPAGVRCQRWYLGAECSLAPVPQSENGSDRFSVDFRASSGIYNRWWELGVTKGQPVQYSDRGDQQDYVLAYQSLPLEHDLEIAGSPLLTLRVKCNLPDCAFFAYLEDVLPDGRIVCVTDGQLRAIHRQPLRSDAPLDCGQPLHSFLTEDALPLVPGEVCEVRFALLPVSILFRAGHRIRIALAGHDDGNFPRVPVQGQPVWEIQRGPFQGSYLELPVKS